MSEGDAGLKTSQLIQTLDALQGAQLDSNVLLGLERELQKGLKVVAADLPISFCRTSSAVKETLSTTDNTETHSKIQYDFATKLMAAGLTIRCCHRQWQSGGGKAGLLTLIKSHSAWNELTNHSGHARHKPFLQRLGSRIGERQYRRTESAMREEKKRRAGDAGNLVTTLIKDCDQFAHGLRDGSSWKASDC